MAFLRQAPLAGRQQIELGDDPAEVIRPPALDHRVQAATATGRTLRRGTVDVGQRPVRLVKRGAGHPTEAPAIPSRAYVPVLAPGRAWPSIAPMAD